MRKLIAGLALLLIALLAYQLFLKSDHADTLNLDNANYQEQLFSTIDEKQSSSNPFKKTVSNMVSGLKMENSKDKSVQPLSSDELLSELSSNAKNNDVKEKRQYSGESLVDHLKAVDLADVMSNYISDNKEVIFNMKQDCVREKLSGLCVLTPNDMTEQENKRWKADTEILVRSLILEFINGKNITLEAIYCDLKICEVLIAFDFSADGPITYNDNHQEFSRMVYFINQHPSLNILYERTDLHSMGNPSSHIENTYYRYFVLLLNN